MSRHWKGVCAALMIAGCGNGEKSDAAALDLELLPDPNVNAPLQLVEQLGTIALTVDAPEGLYFPGDEQDGKNFQIKNADTDPLDLELVIVASPKSERLPLIRLERGGLEPDVWLRITARGFAGDGEFRASGELKGATFGAGVQAMPLPFNLLPQYLPPRVTSVAPLLDGCTVRQLTLNFSRAIEPTTLPGAVTLGPNAGTAEVRVDPERKFAEVVPASVINGAAGQVQFSLHVAETVKAADDEIFLDDVPAQPGAQPYVQEFTLTCGITSSDAPSCGKGAPGQSELCPPGFDCSPEDVCLPIDCASLACSAGYVCDPASRSCAIDCRIYGDDAGICPSPTSCDEAAGICR